MAPLSPRLALRALRRVLLAAMLVALVPLRALRRVLLAAMLVALVPPGFSLRVLRRRAVVAALVRGGAAVVAIPRRALLPPVAVLLTRAAVGSVRPHGFLKVLAVVVAPMSIAAVVAVRRLVAASPAPVSVVLALALPGARPLALALRASLALRVLALRIVVRALVRFALAFAGRLPARAALAHGLTDVALLLARAAVALVVPVAAAAVLDVQLPGHQRIGAAGGHAESHATERGGHVNDDGLRPWTSMSCRACRACDRQDKLQLPAVPANIIITLLLISRSRVQLACPGQPRLLRISGRGSARPRLGGKARS